MLIHRDCGHIDEERQRNKLQMNSALLWADIIHKHRGAVNTIRQTFTAQPGQNCRSQMLWYTEYYSSSKKTAIGRVINKPFGCSSSSTV